MKRIIDKRRAECEEVKVPLRYYLPAQDIDYTVSSPVVMYMTGLSILLGLGDAKEMDENDGHGLLHLSTRVKESGILDEEI